MPSCQVSSLLATLAFGAGLGLGVFGLIAIAKILFWERGEGLGRKATA